MKLENEFNNRSRVIFDKLSIFLTQAEVKKSSWLSRLVGTSKGAIKDNQKGVWAVEIDDFYI